MTKESSSQQEWHVQSGWHVPELVKGVVVSQNALSMAGLQSLAQKLLALVGSGG